MSQVQQKHAQADSIATDHAQGRIARRVDQEVGDRIAKARKRYDQDYRLPLARKGELPERHPFPDNGRCARRRSDPGQPGAVGRTNRATRRLPAGKDLVVRVHESATNNYLGLAAWRRYDQRRRSRARHQGRCAAAEMAQRRLGESPRYPLPLAKIPTSNRGRCNSIANGRLRWRSSTARFGLILHIAHLDSGHEFSRWDVAGNFTPETHRRRCDAEVATTSMPIRSAPI